MKRLVSIILLVVMIFPSVVLADVTNSTVDTFGELLYEVGLIKGDNDGLSPQKILKREELITIINRLGDKEDFENFVPPTTPTFKDVPPSHWAYKHVEYAYSKRVTRGMSYDTFGLGAKVNANQLALFLLRSMGYSDDVVNGTKVPYEEAYSIARELKGILADDVLDPMAEITRSSVFQMTYLSLLANSVDGEKFLYSVLQGVENKEELIQLVIALADKLSNDLQNYDPDNNDPGSDPDHDPSVLPPEIDVSPELAYIKFSLELFKKSVEDDRTQNTCVSPMSVWTALAMTSNGAKGETLRQMESTLNLSTESLNDYIHKYMQSIADSETPVLSIANAIWFNKGLNFKVNQDFLDTNEEYYGAEIRGEVFTPELKDEINLWVEKNTMGMIKDILDYIDPYAVMYLVNALAFDAEWQVPYAESQVHEGEFKKEDGTVQDVEMMYSDEYGHIKGELAEGFIKLYKDRKHAFMAILPNEDITLDEYIDSFEANSMKLMLKPSADGAVHVGLPKFETSYKTLMNKVLNNMGMVDAFNSELADFTGLGTSDANIYINRVIHQTLVSVGEKGTEAGAATVVEMVKETAVLDPPKPLIFDRPFLYMIVDLEHRVPLFIGIIRSLD